MMFPILFAVFVASTGVFASASQGVACDFEGDLCGYTFDLSGDFNWTHSNETPSRFTGPSGDHTTGSGWFAYVETSWPRIGGEKARLESPEIDSSSGENCLQFYYHMYGTHVHQLNVYMSNDMASPVWVVREDQGEQWLQARIPLTGASQNFKVVFEGVSGSSYRADIAIDDVTITNDPSCSILPSTADPSLYVAPPSIPVPPLPAQPFCGFKAPSSRIVGGNRTKKGDWPWQAMLMTNTTADGTGWNQFCGGSLIYSNWVLTAAHCVIDKLPMEIYKIRMGAHFTNTSRTDGKEQDFDIIETHIHPRFNFDSMYNNDLALLRLDGHATQSNRINYVCLPSSGHQFPEGHMCSLSGWGNMKTDDDAEVLMHVEVPLLSHANCTGPDNYEPNLISPEMLCAGFAQGGKDTCQGDSGGPLSCEEGYKWYIHGVTSWGYGCALPDYPGVYARVGEFLDWIATVVANSNTAV